MPQNGYWIECIPVSIGDNDQKTNDGAPLYRAQIPAIPETQVIAKTPDRAIQELRDKLASVRHEYCTRGQNLPEHDSPITPPRNNKSVKGWISVYVNMSECCHNNNH